MKLPFSQPKCVPCQNECGKDKDKVCLDGVWWLFTACKEMSGGGGSCLEEFLISLRLSRQLKDNFKITNDLSVKTRETLRQSQKTLENKGMQEKRNLISHRMVESRCQNNSLQLHSGREWNHQLGTTGFLQRISLSLAESFFFQIGKTAGDPPTSSSKIVIPKFTAVVWRNVNNLLCVRFSWIEFFSETGCFVVEPSMRAWKNFGNKVTVKKKGLRTILQSVARSGFRDGMCQQDWIIPDERIWQNQKSLDESVASSCFFLALMYRFDLTTDSRTMLCSTLLSSNCFRGVDPKWPLRGIDSDVGGGPVTWTGVPPSQSVYIRSVNHAENFQHKMSFSFLDIIWEQSSPVADLALQIGSESGNVVGDALCECVIWLAVSRFCQAWFLFLKQPDESVSQLCAAGSVPRWAKSQCGFATLFNLAFDV